MLTSADHVQVIVHPNATSVQQQIQSVSTANTEVLEPGKTGLSRPPCVSLQTNNTILPHSNFGFCGMYSLWRYVYSKLTAMQSLLLRCTLLYQSPHTSVLVQVSACLLQLPKKYLRMQIASM